MFFSPEKKDISSFLEESVSRGKFPGGVVLLSDAPEKSTIWTYGERVSSPHILPIKEDTIFDLASLTKPLITSLLFLLLMREGIFSLDDAISRFLPRFRGTDKEKITLRDLLTHTAGFPSWLPLYALAQGKVDIASVIKDYPLSYPVGSRVVYSCLGYIIFGIIIEQATGSSLSQISSELIFRPLSLRRTFFPPPPHIRDETAATEFGRAYEREKAKGFGEGRFPFPDELVWGEVHDGNACFLGGAAGNAGLFSTAHDVFLLANEFLGWGGLLSPDERHLFFENLTPGMNEAWSLGFKLAETKESPAFSILDRSAGGHIGFTGTGLFIDPVNHWIVIFLTNRVHPRVPEAPFNPLRRQLLFLARDYLEGNVRN
jgi:CubicO group peptidase (beta-lactamase class C family)